MFQAYIKPVFKRHVYKSAVGSYLLSMVSDYGPGYSQFISILARKQTPYLEDKNQLPICTSACWRLAKCKPETCEAETYFNKIVHSVGYYTFIIRNARSLQHKIIRVDAWETIAWHKTCDA
jgi:hypothetical protein